MTSVIEEKLRQAAPRQAGAKADCTACEKLGYCVQLNRPTGAPPCRRWPASWANGGRRGVCPRCAEAALLARCGEDQFLLKNEVDKLAALAGYGTITAEMVGPAGHGHAGRGHVRYGQAGSRAASADQAQQKLKTLLALQNEPIMITGALIGNYHGSVPRAAGPSRSRRGLGRCGQGLWLQVASGATAWAIRPNARRRASSAVQLEDCLDSAAKSWTPT